MIRKVQSAQSLRLPGFSEMASQARYQVKVGSSEDKIAAVLLTFTQPMVPGIDINIIKTVRINKQNY